MSIDVHRSGSDRDCVRTVPAASIGMAAVVLAAAGVPVAADWSPVYSIQRLALYGPEYTAADGSILSYLGFAGGSGLVVGYSERRTVPGGESNGVDVWVSSGGSEPQRIGLTAPAYTGRFGFRSGEVLGISETGVVLGGSRPQLETRDYLGPTPWVWTETGGTVAVGLSGPEYVGVGGYRAGWTLPISPSGQVAGVSGVLGGTPSGGGHAWAWNLDRGAVRIGLRDAAHTYEDGSQFSSVRFQNDAGDVCGISSFPQLPVIGDGQSAWHWDAQSGTVAVGLTGPEHTGTLGRRESSINAQNSQGQLIGTSALFINESGTIGADAWVWNRRVGTQRIGLLGDAFTGPYGSRSSYPFSQNESGRVIGSTIRSAADGTDNGVNAWTWSEASGTQAIGLTGPDFTGVNGYQESLADLQNNQGMVCGASALFSSDGQRLGAAAWVWSEQLGTQPVGLSDPDHVGSDGQRSSWAWWLSQTGMVVGGSQRIGDDNVFNGASSWVWTVDGGTVRIGLVGPEHTGPGGLQDNWHRFASESGWIVGIARLHPRREAGMMVETGQASWAWASGHGTVEIGLLGPRYTRNDGSRHSEVHAQNASGCVFGSSARYDGGTVELGRDPWYFDPATMETYFPMRGVAEYRSDTRYLAYSNAFTLAADGILYGQYTVIEPLTGISRDRAFAFRPDLGFVDLSGLVAGGLASTGWRELEWVRAVGPDGVLVGYGAFGERPGDFSTFIMRPIPAPVCPADVTGDRTVDGADFVAFVNSFSLGDAAADAAADLNRDGTIDGGDFVAFMAAFAAGC
jgi:hypothetical protein